MKPKIVSPVPVKHIGDMTNAERLEEVKRVHRAVTSSHRAKQAVEDRWIARLSEIVLALAERAWDGPA